MPVHALLRPCQKKRPIRCWLKCMPFYILGAVIPMLEVALDGALCTFLLDSVDDPVCHQAFKLINGDEARHLGVGFLV